MAEVVFVRLRSERTCLRTALRFAVLVTGRSPQLVITRPRDDDDARCTSARADQPGRGFPADSFRV